MKVLIYFQEKNKKRYCLINYFICFFLKIKRKKIIKNKKSCLVLGTIFEQAI